MSSRRLARLLGVITAFAALVAVAYGVTDGGIVTMGWEWSAPAFNTVTFR